MLTDDDICESLCIFMRVMYLYVPLACENRFA